MPVILLDQSLDPQPVLDTHLLFFLFLPVCRTSYKMYYCSFDFWHECPVCEWYWSTFENGKSKRPVFEWSAIWKADNFMSNLLSTIWIPDTSGIQIPTVFMSSSQQDCNKIQWQDVCRGDLKNIGLPINTKRPKNPNVLTICF